MKKLTTKDVSRLIKQAGFKSKAEFARQMGISENTVNVWGLTNPPPVYLNKVLEWAKKAKAYDELMKEE